MRPTLARILLAGFCLTAVILMVACGGERVRPNLTPGGVAPTAAAGVGATQPPGGGLNALAATAEAGAQTAAAIVGEAGGTAAALATEAAPTAAALASQAVALAGTAQSALTTITPPAIIGQAEASTVINQYASDILGISVVIVKAGGLTTDIARGLNLSEAGQAAQTGSVEMAVATYAATLQNGAASVSYGSGATAGDLTVDINSASLGAFSVDAAGLPATEAEAFALVLQTFPSLSTRSFNPYPVAKGYAWLAEGDVPGIDLQTRQATLVSERALVGITPLSPRRSSVYAVVGKGSFAAQVAP